MLLIEVFAEYIIERKNLNEYVEVRKTIDQRGEFNDATLIQAQENLDMLAHYFPDIYENMYKILAQYIAFDAGHTVEYPINFVREILTLSKPNVTPQTMYENYKGGLEHHVSGA